VEVGFPIGGKRARGYRRFLDHYLYEAYRHYELLAERLQAEAWYTVGAPVLGGICILVHKLLAKYTEELPRGQTHWRWKSGQNQAWHSIYVKLRARR